MPRKPRKPTTARPPPQTPREMALWRCKTQCQMGRDAHRGENDPHTLIDYRLFLLLCAVQDLAEALSCPTPEPPRAPAG